MVRSGERVDLSSIPGPKVGKHSTGGVGDKVSIVLAPLVAACGVVVPKMSGRGLGHTGGTLDKLESIPGFRVALTLEEFLRALSDIGCALISQTASIAPADKKLYALRDVTATVESVPLISASVMSKKLAEGSSALVLDVKCGRGAFMHTLPDATALARSLVSIGTAAGVPTEAFISNMDAPLGRAVGNGLEIAECIETLSGRGPADLEALVRRLATRMVRLGGVVSSDDEAERAVTRALDSGAALEKLRAVITRQGGDARVVDEPGRLPQARERSAVVSPASGFVGTLDAELVGRASMLLGAGRDRLDAAIDHAAGIVIHRKPGEAVRAGDPVMELYYNDGRRLDEARALALEAIVVGEAPAEVPRLVMGWIRREEESTA
jgi:pyrimidine-nucleoside phosphorylase